MISGALITKLIIAFLTGAASVSTLSIVTDRFGSKLGGALGGFPLTVAASLLFLGLATDVESAVRAAVVVPALMGAYGIALAAYCTFVYRGAAAGLSAAVAVWAALTILLKRQASADLTFSVLAFLVLSSASYILSERLMKIPSSAGRPISLSWRQVLFRMLCGGGSVAGAVYLGAVSGPTVAGIVASFPAVTLATLFLAYSSGGPAVSAALSKAMLLSGMINVTVYALSVQILYPHFGLWLGTALGFIVACGTGYATFIFLRHGTT